MTHLAAAIHPQIANAFCAPALSEPHLRLARMPRPNSSAEFLCVLGWKFGTPRPTELVAFKN
jgi:hypothetical protein